MIARGLETAIEDAIPYQPDALAERLAALVACRAALEGCRETVHEPLVRRILESSPRTTVKAAGVGLALREWERSLRPS